VARRPRIAPKFPVTWRDGVHLTGTPIWCDARRRRDICFLSSADRVGRTGHGQLIGTSLTLALLGARDVGHLAVPLRQRFTLGTLRLELIPSGRGFGAAALHVDIAGKTVLYAGAVRTTAGGVGDAAELRTCDAVVVAAPYGEPHHRFPPLGEAIAATIGWTHAQLAAGRRPVLLVDSLLDGLEVASRLAAEGIAVAGGRALREAGQRIADLVASPQRVGGAIAIGSTISPRSLRAPEPGSGIPAIPAPGRDPRAIVWLDADRAGLARSLGDRPFATALVSARAPGGAARYDAGFGWAAAADRAQLLGWIEATGARDVFVTGACAEAIAGALGPRARVIGPPHQMPLFPHEAAP
jgi:putative mRNA 3-end processing factor